MRSKYVVLAVALSVSVVSIAWSADEPTPPATAPAPQPAPAAQPASSTATEPAKTPAKATPKSASGKDSETEAQEKHLIAEGYKKETRGGITVFCRMEAKIGSRFETKHCGSAQDMAYAEQQARDLMNNSKNAQGSRVN